MIKVLYLVLIIFVSFTAQAGLFWGAYTENQPVYDSDGVTALPLGDSSVLGAFAQLIRITAGSSAGVFTGTGTGIDVANETIADYMYAGQYDNSLPDGYFAYNIPSILNNTSFNGFYYVRVFNAPQSSQEDFDSALIPATATHYYESATFQYTHNETSPDTYDFGDNSTTLAIVPEPSVIAIMGLGLFGLASARRRLQA